MNKLLLSAVALASLTGSAVAADMPARTYTKAPAPSAASSWTGFYLSGGGGYGMWNSDNQTLTYPGGVAFAAQSQRMGGSGYFGTVGGGYDWQFSGPWVAGVFADGQFGSIRGAIADPYVTTFGAPNPLSGSEKLRTSWAAGVRVGYLIAPSVYSYVNGGYTGAQFSGSTLYTDFTGTPARTTGAFTRNGWFVGGGVENQINVLGFGPSWFMKTEYRSSEYTGINDQQLTLGGAPTGFGIAFKPWVQTVSTSLVYRFNWTGPLVAKY
jgi:outer membrane immunogenic protein